MSYERFSSYLLKNFLRSPTSPNKPEPRSQTEGGMGTGADSTWPERTASAYIYCLWIVVLAVL